MYKSMGTNLETTKTGGSSTSLQKIKSLYQQWSKATNHTIEKLQDKNLLGRDYIYQKEGTFYRILSAFKKSYGKWCYETYADEGESTIVHVQEFQYYFNAYQPTTK